MPLDLRNLENLLCSDTYVSKTIIVVKIAHKHSLLILRKRKEHCLGHGNVWARFAIEHQVVATQDLLALHVGCKLLFDECANLENAVHIVSHLIHHAFLMDLAIVLANILNNYSELFQLVI